MNAEGAGKTLDQSSVEIVDAGPERLADYADVPIAFQVESILKVDMLDGGLGGARLTDVQIAPAYLRDYDAGPESGPLSWPEKFDIKNFGFFIALDGDRPVGAAAAVYDTPGINMLDGRSDMAVLWDIRVRPEVRRKGIGAMLFEHAARWARARNCRLLKIETQNVNVPACRFYHRMGGRLGEINRYAYAGHPGVAHEVMLVWYLDL
jgi:GNAT superfamily N-acetyltransferase